MGGLAAASALLATIATSAIPATATSIDATQTAQGASGANGANGTTGAGGGQPAPATSAPQTRRSTIATPLPAPTLAPRRIIISRQSGRP